MAVSMEIRLFGKIMAQVEGIAHTTPMNVQQLMEPPTTSAPTRSACATTLGPGLRGRHPGRDRRPERQRRDSYLFWALYINGELSSTGIDRTVIDDGDVIAWNYQGYSDQEFDGTRHEEIRDRMLAR